MNGNEAFPPVYPPAESHPMTALAEQLRRAKVYDLEQPRFAGMPIHPVHRPGYLYTLHRRHRDGYQPGRPITRAQTPITGRRPRTEEKYPAIKAAQLAGKGVNMSRVIGLAALGLGGIGLVGCLAGLIGIWAVRPSFLRSSVEVLDTADGGLKLVSEKTTRADELLKAI